MLLFVRLLLDTLCYLYPLNILINYALLQMHQSRERSREKRKSVINEDEQKIGKGDEQRIVRGEEHNKQSEDKDDSDIDLDMFAEEFAEKSREEAEGETGVTDEEGYYRVVEGSVIGEQKYRVMEKLGKGVFGVVIRCENIESKEIVAIKILRKNSVTQKSGEREYSLLSKIKSKRILRAYEYFVEEGHLCLVCEVLSVDLRSYIHRKQPGLDDIRLYAISMFLIAHELSKHQVIHADIKPDNFMFKEAPILPHPRDQTSMTSKEEKSIIDNMKVVDFGTAFWVHEHSNQVEYQVARYYRAPEIMLGTRVKTWQMFAVDVWAIACSLYQMYTSEFLFNGSSNNQMLRQIMETKGRFNIKMLNKSEFAEKHFDKDHNFLFQSIDPMSKELRVQKMQVTITSERDLANLLKKKSIQLGEDSKKVQNFKDFLERALALNPKDRLTPQQAMEHPFLHYQIKLD